MQDSLWLLTRLYQAGLVTYRITTKGFGFWSTTFPRLDLARRDEVESSNDIGRRELQDAGVIVSYKWNLLFFGAIKVLDNTY